MEIDERIRNKFESLIQSGEQLKHGNEHGTVRGEPHLQECVAWLTSAHNTVHLVITNSNNPYRISIDRICGSNHGYTTNNSVGEVTLILKLLLQDIDLGLLTSIEDQTKAAIFDDFLDHAKYYSKNKRKNEAGVIAGVVFEDSLRNICRNIGIKEQGKKLDTLIDDLVKIGTLNQVKAKRAKVSAHVRTKATHAQWEEFELTDVNTTIVFTEELILSHLER